MYWFSFQRSFLHPVSYLQLYLLFLSNNLGADIFQFFEILDNGYSVLISINSLSDLCK